MPFSQHRVLFWYLVVFGIMLAVPATAEDEAVINNLERMRRLTAEVAEELVASVPDHVNMGHVILAPYEASEQYKFTDHVFTGVLTDGGHRVFESAPSLSMTSRSDSTSATTLRLEYQALHFGLIYPKIYRPFLIGGRKVKRQAGVRLLAKLIDPRDESVVWLGEASRSHEDQFPYGQLAVVEVGTFAFTKPSRSSTGWGKVIEPVVVSGIIIGLIYLFFSNQNE